MKRALLERSGSVRSLSHKVGETFLNERDSLSIQDESRKHIDKSRFSEKRLCCFGKITPKLSRRLGNLL
jgi:hypothetical protein